jgi:hypothetical protein
MKVLEQGYIYDVEKSGSARRTCCCTSFRPLRSGKILASFRLGSNKDSADGNCLVAESTDQGKNWAIISEGFETTVDSVTGEIRVAELSELADGTLAAFVMWVDRLGGKSLYNGQTDSVLPTKLVMTKSSDGGRTWQAYQKLDTKDLLGPAISGPTVHLPGRGWLVPFENLQPGLGIHTANALFSSNGTLFDKILTVAHDPEDKIYFFDERNALCPKTGRLVTMFWTYNRKTEKDEEIHIAWGDPNTLEWEKPFSTGIKGQVCQPIPLPDGRLAAFYVNRHAPGSMRLILSEDKGKTWDSKGELVVHMCDEAKQRGLNGESDYAQYWDDMLTTWTFGHPTGVVLADGTLLLGYYAGPSVTCLSVHWARVQL